MYQRERRRGTILISRALPRSSKKNRSALYKAPMWSSRLEEIGEFTSVSKSVLQALGNCKPTSRPVRKWFSLCMPISHYKRKIPTNPDFRYWDQDKESAVSLLCHFEALMKKNIASVWSHPGWGGNRCTTRPRERLFLDRPLWGRCVGKGEREVARYGT